MILIDFFVGAIMLAAATAAMWVRNLVSAVILVGVVSLAASFIFLRLGAPDVAMTEAAIGSALSTVIFLIVVRRTESHESGPEVQR
jgi:uncharacterized MnhB-related membrane protein